MIVECDNCGKEFDKIPAEVKRRKHNFCSKECYAEYRKNDEGVLSQHNKLKNGCWEWTAFKNKDGYGVTSYKGKREMAHRVSFMVANNLDDLMDKHVLHICDNPGCINPEHLMLGTHTDNMRDMHKKQRWVSKLNPDDVKYIRKSDRSNAELSKMFNVAERTIRYAKQKGKWKHVEG